jgi:hypothetical protein
VDEGHEGALISRRRRFAGATFETSAFECYDRSMIGRTRPPATEATFEELQATALFCPRCRAAQPVRQRLLLVLPDGEIHEYRCTACGEHLGKRTTAVVAPRLFGD